MIYSTELKDSAMARINTFFNMSFTPKIKKQSSTSGAAVWIKEINANLRFKDFFSMPFVFEGGYYLANLRIGKMNISVAEKSYAKFLDDIKIQLKHVWEYYGTEEDEKLNDEAKKVKNWLINRMEQY